jgi:LuxR family maltose regulon positive regulatory protein
VAELHRRASQWYEEHGLELDAFHHAAAANDIERAERLIEGKGVPLHFRGAGAPILNWLQSLPATVLDARPSLWVTYASALFFVAHQHTAVEQRLQAAEAALAHRKTGAEPDDSSNDLLGRIASLRATLAIIQHDVGTIIVQSRRALEYLPLDNLPARTTATYTLGHAYQLQGDRDAASRAYTEIISSSKSFGYSIYMLAATIGLGQIKESDNQLPLAMMTYRHALQLAGDPPQPMACVAYLGLANISYERNELDAAHQYGQQCLQLTRTMESVDTFALYQVLQARLRLARGDVPGAVAALDEAEAFVRGHNFAFMLPDIAAAQVLTLLRQNKLEAAALLAQSHDLPLSQARVHLAQGNPSAALAVLEPVRLQAEARGWQDERLKVMLLEALALHAQGDPDQALHRLGEALALAEPGGFIRLFVDEGAPMAHLLAAACGMMPDYTVKLLAAFETAKPKDEDTSVLPQALPAQPLSEPLSQRELEVLRLMAQGLSNRQISERLFLALSTVKGHNQIIFSKLQVQRRTEAVARARELGLV